MKKEITKILSVILISIGLVGVSFAEQPESPLQSELKAFLVTDGEAGEVLNETDTVEPGKVIEYQIRYSNVADAPLRRIQAQGYVPEDTFLLEGSIRQPEGITTMFSIDDGRSFHVPPIPYTYTDEDGRSEERIATTDMYQYIRWDISELSSGESIEFSYRVEVR